MRETSDTWVSNFIKITSFDVLSSYLCNFDPSMATQKSERKSSAQDAKGGWVKEEANVAFTVTIEMNIFNRGLEGLTFSHIVRNLRTIFLAPSAFTRPSPLRLLLETYRHFPRRDKFSLRHSLSI